MLTPLYYTPFVMLPDSQHLASIPCLSASLPGAMPRWNKLKRCSTSLLISQHNREYWRANCAGLGNG
ncbi:hypothetical protein ACTJKU_22750, partial [Citrobacter freundii]